MIDGVGIEIIIDKPCIASLHETVTSIIKQLNIDYLDIHLNIINKTNLNISSEVNRLKKARINIAKKPINTRFFISIKSGEVLSRSFIYKSLHFFKNNNEAFVCPEYTFSKISDAFAFATISNNQILQNKASAVFIDKNKLNQSNFPISPRVAIVKDTCVAINPIDIGFFSYLRKIKKAQPYFENIAFHAANLSKQNLYSNIPKSSLTSRIKNSLKELIHSISGRSKILNKALSPQEDESELPIHTNSAPYISDAMKNELEYLSNIKYSFKGFQNMQFIDITYEVSENSEQLLDAYQPISKALNFNDYSYIMVLPWLIPGGIDLFAVNYLNSIAEQLPNQHILVLLTDGTYKSFNKKQLNLSSNIDLINLPEILNNNQEKLKLAPQIIYSLVNTLHPDRLHIIASKLGYDSVINYGNDIRTKGTKILFSSYNYIIGQHGEYTGYTVQELPEAYRPGDTITTDNDHSKDLWINQYGFIGEDILVHNQLFNTNEIQRSSPTSKDGLRILWAAHIRPEKNPEIVPKIAERLKKDRVDIDCYGLFNSKSWEDGRNPLATNLNNLHYKGAYSNFFKDINLSDYDLFLYTSHSDGTPNVIIEAALAGLPIIASKIGGIPSTLGKEALLIEDSNSVDDFVNAILNTLSNLDTARKKAETIRKRLENKHNKIAFDQQVKDMLKRSRP